MLTSDDEIIMDGGRGCRFSLSEKLRVAEKTLDGTAGISVVERRNGLAPNLLYRRRHPLDPPPLV